MLDSEQLVLIEAAEKVWEGSSEHLNIRMAVGAKLAETLQPFFGSKPELVFITDSDIRHIKRKHGRMEEVRGQQTITPEDFACIPEVLNNFDSCDHVDTDKLGNKKFLLRKNVGKTVYILTIQRGKKKLQIKTMWKENRSGASC